MEGNVDQRVARLLESGTVPVLIIIMINSHASIYFDLNHVQDSNDSNDKAQQWAREHVLLYTGQCPTPF